MAGLLDFLSSGSGGGLLDFLRSNGMNQQYPGLMPSDTAQYGQPMGAMAQAPVMAQQNAQPAPMQANAQIPQMPPPIIPAQSVPQMSAPTAQGQPQQSGVQPFQMQRPNPWMGDPDSFLNRLAGTDPATQGLAQQQFNQRAIISGLKAHGVADADIMAGLANPKYLDKLLENNVKEKQDYRPATDAERKAAGVVAGQPLYIETNTNKPMFGPNQTNVTTNVNNPTQETARAKAIGEIQGKEVIGKDIQAGAGASNVLRTLATLDEANKQGGDDLSSGPFGKAVLSGKQALAELTGTELKGLPESEVTQKVGFDLATKMVKAISNRPSQMEFGKALENVPSIYMSKPGRTAMISILSQQANADREIGRLANKPENWENYQDVKDKYYADHPLMSPFTGKPFGESDIQMLAKSASKTGGAQSRTVNGYTIRELP